MEQNPHVTDLIPAYALGALEPDEQDKVKRHLMECPGCDMEAQRVEQVTDGLLLAPMASEEVSAPLDLRDRLLARVRALQGERAPGVVDEASGGGLLRRIMRALFGRGE